MNERWWKSFRERPRQAVADLFSGRAGTGSTLRLDLPEMLYQAFPPHRLGDRALLDGALGHWLHNMRENYAEEARRLGGAVLGKRASDALIAVRLLDLQGTRERIRADVDGWVRWLVPLRLAPERDPALECWRLMTRGQEDVRHMASWLRLAEDPREEYLTVALAGLTSLPNDGDAHTSQHFAVRAVLRHIAANHHHVAPARRLLNGHLAALQCAFPRAPEHWNQTFRAVLDAEADGWPEFVKDLRPQPRSSGRPHADVEPFTEWRSLESAIAEDEAPPDELAHRLFAALEQNQAFARATGLSDFFVRTLCNIGHRLLDRYGRLGGDAMGRLGEMIERAMVWEPSNPYCWTFWAEWLKVQRNYLAHEWVLRETVRLFPDSEAAHAELARTLMARGETELDEAEHILRRPFSIHRGGGHSRVLLARLLRQSGRGSEAADLLEAHIALDPANDAVRHALAQAKAASDEEPGYRPAGTDVALEPDAADLSSFEHATSWALVELAHRGELGKEFIKAQVAKHMELKPNTTCIEREASNGDTLAGFYSQWLKLDTTPELPTHAWAWNACRVWQSGCDDWGRLAEQFPELAPQTEFLGVLAAGVSADGWSKKHERRKTVTRSSVMRFMKEAATRLDGIGTDEREDIAFAVMGSEATSALEFSVAD